MLTLVVYHPKKNRRRKKKKDRKHSDGCTLQLSVKLLRLSWGKRPNKSDLHQLMVCGITLIYRPTLHALLPQIPTRNSGCLCGICRILIKKWAGDLLSPFLGAVSNQRSVRKGGQRRPKPSGFIWWQGFVWPMKMQCRGLSDSWTLNSGSVTAGLCHSWVQRCCKLVGSDCFFPSCARYLGFGLTRDFRHQRPEGLSGQCEVRRLSRSGLVCKQDVVIG